MKAPLQGSDELLIHARPEDIWHVLEDGTCLPKWMPMVKHTTGTREVLGAVRECTVEMSGRKGRSVERCVESIPHRRIAWALEEDTLGFNKLLADFSFSFTLEPRGPAATLVRNDTYFRPKGLLARLMNAPIMSRKFRRVRQDALRGIQRLAEGTSQAPRDGTDDR